MKIKKGFIIRKVGDENIVVPVGEASKNFHGMVKLNESGAFLWKFFTENHTEEEAVDALLSEYDVEKDGAARDVKGFVEVLTKNSFAE